MVKYSIPITIIMVVTTLTLLGAVIYIVFHPILAEKYPLAVVMLIVFAFVLSGINNRL